MQEIPLMVPENLKEFSGDLLEMIFSYLKKRDVKSVALTCVKFSKIFHRPHLRETIINNKAVDYHHMNNAQLQLIILQKPDVQLFILSLAHDRFKNGQLDLSMLRGFVLNCPLQRLYQFGRFLNISNDSNKGKEIIIFTLLEKIVCSAEYYSGTSEYKNPHFMSMVDSLARVDLNNLWKRPVLVENIVSLFQYVYITLPDHSSVKSNLKELFETSFVICVSKEEESHRQFKKLA